MSGGLCLIKIRTRILSHQLELMNNSILFDRNGCLCSEGSSCTFQQDPNLSLTPLINTVCSLITGEQVVVERWGWAAARSNVSGFVFITDTLWALLSQCQDKRDGRAARCSMSTRSE